ncbi:MAG: Integrase [candidate division TM6 bacterium GW2011_GWE2_41_16]|nr:MAG: Integrase [candidate division TM6 bacterium GW2011_GWE2_41_16]
MIKTTQSAVSRELARNSSKKGYRHKQAQAKHAKRRHDASSAPKKMSPDLIAKIEHMLREDQFSPDQISGRLKLTNGISISHESIYQHILKDKKNGGDLYKNLRRSGKKYNKRGSKMAGRGLIPNRVGIEHRPMEVEQKIRVGDFEADTIIGSMHRGALLSIVDRKTKLTLLRLLPNTKAQNVAREMIDALAPIKTFTHTITTDNGKEFAQHQSVAGNLGVQCFFANPYHAWERGLNENTNGLVRQYLPKKCDFSKLNSEQVFMVQQKLNNRPRKSLEYRTPNEEFLRLTGLSQNYALRC